ncbi:MAG: sigma-70 family RNA polymerase sigma factor [Bacteroidota bacterium]
MQTQLPSRCEENILTVIPNLKTRSVPNLVGLDDTELVSRYVNGDEACLAILVERHKNRMFAFIIKRTRDRMLAEDIFQETFFKVIRSLKAGMYNEQDKFINWAMRISRNLIIDHFRRCARVRTISSVRNAEGEQTDIFNVIDVEEKIHRTHVEKRQAHRQIRHLIKRLPNRQRQVLVMREYFDMSFNEIKKFRRMNINTALGAMRYAIINLRKMAKQEGLKFD